MHVILRDANVCLANLVIWIALYVSEGTDAPRQGNFGPKTAYAYMHVNCEVYKWDVASNLLLSGRTRELYNFIKYFMFWCGAIYYIVWGKVKVGLGATQKMYVQK